MSSTSDMSDEGQSGFYMNNICSEGLFESYNDNYINSSYIDNNYETFDNEQKDKSIDIFFLDKKTKNESHDEEESEKSHIPDGDEMVIHENTDN